VSTCSACGSSNAEDARFCSACGERLTPAEAPTPEVRKTVTIVFCDVVGSTSLAEGLDPETWGAVMVRYFDRMRAALERHGGSIEKFIGDAVMAVFGLPTANEDDALRAVRAAEEMRASLAELNAALDQEFGIRIQSRTGVHTGEIVASGVPDRPMPLGDAANTAARFEQAAGPGEILIGSSTHHLVRDAVLVEPVEPLTLKGKAEPVPAYRLLEVLVGAQGVARRMGAPMVGREEELETLLQALRTAEAERGSLMVTVVGEAGVGKSRLMAEFQKRVAHQATILQGRCLPYGEAITFWPIAEALRAAAEIRDDDPRELALSKLSSLASGDREQETVTEVVAAAIGLSGGGASAEETSWALRRMLTQMATRSLLVVVLDDLQWAAKVLLDLIEGLAAEVTAVPLLLFGMARPELLEERPGWPGSHLRLEGLQDQDCIALIGNALEGPPLEPDIGRWIARSTGGNPLFLEELVAMLVDDGSLEQIDSSWTLRRGIGALEVPPTIEALLAARLDRLPREEQTAIELASVIGQVFYPGAMEDLIADEARSGLGVVMDSLIRRDLVQVTDTEFAEEPACRFRHLLIRDAAYRRLPKGRRADVHEGFASWLEREVGERVAEFEEIIGYHLEQAYGFRVELAPATEEDRMLASRAAERLGSAGRRAMERGDGSAAASLTERALALIGTEDAVGIALQLDLAVALKSTGDFARAEELLGDANREAAVRGLKGMGALVEVEKLRLRLSTHPSGVAAEVIERVPQLIQVLERESDERGLAAAWNLMAQVEATSINMGAAKATVRKALAHAERAEDFRQASDIRRRLVAVELWSPTPVPESVRGIDQIVATSGGNPLVHATALVSKGLLVAMLGRFDEGRSLWRQGSDLLDELHQTVWRAAGTELGGWIELLGDDPVAAEEVLRSGYEALEEMGEQGYLSTIAGLLARAVFLQGRLEEAERFSHAAEEASDRSDSGAEMLWRQSRARVLGARSEVEAAERLAREAVRIAATTDELMGHGEALLDLAEILRIAGRPGEAASILTEAMELLARKGAIVLEYRARAALASLGS
jgi:class 3 adenylate cyclase/tetratricopeptide (TPR) repeat protein